MALLKTNNDFGIELNYWKVVRVDVDRESKQGMIVIGLYSQKGFNVPITRKTYFLYDDELFDKYFEVEGDYSDVWNIAYEYLKAEVEEFKDATDDEDQVALLKR